MNSDKEALLTIADNFEKFWGDSELCKDAAARKVMHDEANLLREIAGRMKPDAAG